MNRISWKGRLVALFVALFCAWCCTWYFGWAFGAVQTVASAGDPKYNYETDPSGIGPDFPNYWVKEDYWVAEGCPVSSSVKESAEKVLAPLDADNIAKVAIVCMPDEGFTNPGIWADRFGTYYKIGLAEGPRKNNGIVWLILYDSQKRVVTRVHYSVGDGLNAITAGRIDPIVQEARSAGSIEKAIFVIYTKLNTLARSQYDPWQPQKPSYGGPIDDEENTDYRGILVICVGLLATLGAATIVTEPLLGLAVFLSGSAAIVTWMMWPLYALRILLEVAASASSSSGSSSRSSSRSSSGKSTGGGGSYHRSR